MVLEIAELERTADENERTTLIDEQFTDAAIEVVREKVQPASHPDFDGAHCVECEESLPPARPLLLRHLQTETNRR
jgi:hypothetical protein